MNEVRVGEIRIGKGNPLVLIAGPCVLEGEADRPGDRKAVEGTLWSPENSFHLQGLLMKRIIGVLKNLT